MTRQSEGREISEQTDPHTLPVAKSVRSTSECSVLGNAFMLNANGSESG